MRDAEVKIIGISGSLRRNSYNTALLRAARDLVPAQTAMEVHGIGGIPLYNADLESAEGIPAVVGKIKAAISAADGLLLVTPEYNNGIPGVFKNAIDWMSRPASDIPDVFGGRAVAVIGASPGGFGTILAQDAWLPVLRTLGMKAWWGGRLQISKAHAVFDDAGELIDADVRERLRVFLDGFRAFIADQPDAR